MSRINLLPWREQLRAQRQRTFLTTLALVAVVAAAGVFAVNTYYQRSIEYQQRRNAYLDQQIKLLDKKIEEIKQLDAIKEAVINRIQVIERLQQQRPKIVHLFDEWIDTLPEGVFLTGLEQLDGDVTRLQGSAQSNGRVSTYMNQLDSSDWLNDPRLIIIQTKDAENGTRSSEFTLTVKEVNPLQKKEGEEDEDGEGGAES